ncbi:MAG: M14 family metallopeptidase [Phycisphaerae bacterium]|nr:M14 family metallopeptidase [Phycisphaerae bacterium]
MRKSISNLRATVEGHCVLLTWYKSGAEDLPADEFAAFRICRRQEDNFTFGVDYAEYFDGLSPDGAELVFEGSLAALNDRKFIYRDESVEVGRTYAYFVQGQHGDPVGPAPVKVRDEQVWWSYDHLMTRLRGLAQAHTRSVRLDMCGKTAGGCDIPMLEVGRGAHTLGLVGLVHPGESGPELIVPALERLLKDKPELFEKARVLAIPAVCIDSRERMVHGRPWYLRTNARGVDINRNFPADWETADLSYGLDTSDPDAVTYRGPSPASESETQALMSVLADQPPDLLFSYHSLASIAGLPGLVTTLAANDAEYTAHARAAIERFGVGLFPERKAQDNWLKLSCRSGSLSTWLYRIGAGPAFDLEGGLCAGLDAFSHDRTTIAMLQEYQERHTRAIGSILASWPR